MMVPHISPAGRRSAAIVFLAGVASVGFSGSRAASRRAPEVIGANDNRHPAGRLTGGVLTIALEARTGMWYPEGPNGAALQVASWSEVGKPLQNPGPVIRVPSGTTVKATIHNSLTKPLTVYGFGAKRGSADSIVVPAGQTLPVQFTPTAPGTYYYAGQTVPGPLEARLDEDSQLNGAIVVDPAGTVAVTPDRVFLISWWTALDSTSVSGLAQTTMTINGLSWPHTERLDLVQGDTLRWRVINLTSLPHPMHLHGFYYRIDGKGDGITDTAYASDARRMVVTEVVDPRATMDMTWAPTRPGNWIFHCHFAGHLSHHVALDTHKGVPAPEMDAHHMTDAPHQMYGLVMGIRVASRGNIVQAGDAPRRMRIIVRERPNVYGTHPGYAFVLGGTPDEANADALPVPGPALVLNRGEAVAITIVNRSNDRAAIHWHGIELESYPDGVPGWSGAGKEILPSIAPGDSLTVRFTPPRAGTFMYHSHFNELKQITSGLYGPIIVLAPGERYDPETDRVLLVSDGGPTTNLVSGPFAPYFLNGRAQPAPMELRVGVTYRFRAIDINGDQPAMLALMDGDTPVQWRAIATDGQNLPPSQAIMRPAQIVFAPGQIFDFQFTPRKAGELTLSFGLPAFASPPGAAPKPTLVPVHVR
jgi:FtsP/CotA-like multicopper oxidase with cupredoxin domain